MNEQTIEERLNRLEAALAEYTNYVPPKPEKIYCGPTETQWQRVIDEEFRVEVSDCQDADWTIKPAMGLRYLTNVVPHDRHPYKTKVEPWAKARIPEEVGIRKPHFGGQRPTDHKGKLVIKTRDGVWISTYNEPGGNSDIDRNKWIWAGTPHDFMEYVELP